jgi:peroxin-13
MEVGRRSPAKPWERTGGVGGATSSSAPSSSLPPPRRRVGTTPTSTVSTPALPIAPRVGRGMNSYGGGMSTYGGGMSTYGGGMGAYGGGMSSYGGMTDRYGGYGSSSNGYGSSYGSSSYGSYGGYNSYGRSGGMMSRYGGGYGGSYGSSLGGGYGGYGGGMDRYGGGMDRYGGGYGGYQKPEGLGFVRDFQVLADGFARFSRILDANFDAMYGSLTSVSMLFEHLHNLRREIFFAFQAMSLVGVLRKIWTTWFGAASLPKLLEAPSSTSTTSSTSSTSSTTSKETPQLNSLVAFSQFEKKQDGTQRSRPLRALGLLFLIISAPFILAKLARMFMGVPSNASLLEDGRPKVLAIQDFQGETPEEITFRKGEVMFVLGEPFEGWLEIETVSGERGLIPSNYVRPEEGRGEIGDPSRRLPSPPPPPIVDDFSSGYEAEEQEVGNE